MWIEQGRLARCIVLVLSAGAAMLLGAGPLLGQMCGSGSQAASGCPPFRSYTALAYDSARDEVVMYVVLDVDPSDGEAIAKGLCEIPETNRLRVLW